MNIRIIEILAEIPAVQWNELAGDDPFLNLAYLNALQETGCATPQTGWQAQFITLWEDDKLRAAREAATPLRRIGEPRDIGGIAVFLASQAAAFMTGQCIVADGGVTIL